MAQPQKNKTKVRKIVQKSATEDKTAKVMREFKEGKLKSSDGKLVTDKNQAIAIALSEAGISEKDLVNSEIMNKLKVAKGKLQNLIRKEIAKDESIESQLIDFMTSNPNPNDTAIHGFATKLNLDPSVLEEKIYSLLSSFLSGGKSKGQKGGQIDLNELKMGIQVESEHTGNARFAEKIARDHLTEIPDYYTRLAKMENEAKNG